MKEIIITSSVLILCIMLIRVIFKGKISSRLQYALWILVALRLVIPASAQIYMALGSIEEFRIMDLTKTLESKVGDMSEQLDKPVNARFTMSLNSDNYLARRAAEFILSKEVNMPASEDGPTSVFLAGKIGLTWLDVLRGIWGGGMVIVALWMLIANIIFMRRLHKGRREFVLPAERNPLQDKEILGIEDDKISSAMRKTKIYIIDELASPCLYGLPLRESIYLTADIAENQEMLRHVLTHEMCHKKHGDSFWSIVRSILLIVYWMNPLVWVAAVLSKRDCELACDEAALLMLGEEERISYGETLLSIITRKGKLSDIAYTATTMTGSGKSVKERIKYIAEKPRVLGISVVAVLILVMVVSVLVFTKNPLFHGTTWEGEATLIAGDMQVKLPETIAGISGYDTDKDDDIIVYHVASGKEVGRFSEVSYGEAVTLIEEGREVVPLGNYGSNPYLKEYMSRFLYNLPAEMFSNNTYQPGDFAENEATEHDYEPAGESEPEGVPGIDSNDDTTTYIYPVPDPGHDWMSDSDWEVMPLEEEELQASISYLPDEEIVAVGIPTVTSNQCYIYVKGDYSDVKDQYLGEINYINGELQAVTGRVIILSINQEIRKETFEALAANKTEYLGEAYRVSALVNALPQPDGLQYTGITLQTDTADDLALDVNYQLMTDSFEDVDGVDTILFNAVMLFATIKNLNTCNFFENPAQGTGRAIVTYERADLEEIFGPLWSDEAEDSQEDYVSWLENLEARVTEYLNGELN